MKLSMFASDIHGSLPATERVLELFAQSGAQWLVILGDAFKSRPAGVYRRVTRQPKSLNGLMKWHIRLSLCAATATAKWIKCCCILITAPWQQVLLENNVCLTHGHLLARKIVFALNQNDVLVYGHTHLPVAEQRGRFSTSTPAR